MEYINLNAPAPSRQRGMGHSHKTLGTMNETTVITVVSCVIIWLLGMVLHYYGEYRRMKNEAKQLCDYIEKLEKERQKGL